MRISRSRRPLLWCSLLALTTVGTAQAQAGDESPEPRLKRFSISATGGAAVGGPAGALENEMRAAGFGEDLPCLFLCTGMIERPVSYESGQSFMVALKYRLRKHLAVQLLYGSASTGMTVGSTGGFGGGLRLEHGAQTLAAVATFEEGPLQLGLGPALYMLSVTDGNSGTGEATKLGLVADAGIQFPRNRRFFVDLRAQYRWVGSASMGPYTVSGLFTETAVMPEFSISFNHAWLGIGFGVRL